jgi:polyhydroxyalkanoate synthesis regulator phasin
MPAKNPRLSVVLTPSLAATLAALAEETEESASSLVRGLLEQSEHALRRMLELVKAAKAAKGQISAGVASNMERVVEDLHDAMVVMDARTARVTADLVDQAQAVKGRRRAAGGMRPAAPGGRRTAASTPVPVTRGSGTPGKPASKRKRAGRPASKVATKGVRRGRV